MALAHDLTRTTVPVEWALKPTWMAQGACGEHDPDLFFPERGVSTREAKEVCRGCDVREECFGYAMGNLTMVGVWGGTSHRERIKLSRSKKRLKVIESASSAPYDPAIGAFF